MFGRFCPRSEDLQHLQVGSVGLHLPSFAALVPPSALRMLHATAAVE